MLQLYRAGEIREADLESRQISDFLKHIRGVYRYDGVSVLRIPTLRRLYVVGLVAIGANRFVNGLLIEYSRHVAVGVRHEIERAARIGAQHDIDAFRVACAIFGV